MISILIFIVTLFILIYYGVMKGSKHPSMREVLYLFLTSVLMIIISIYSAQPFNMNILSTEIDMAQSNFADTTQRLCDNIEEHIFSEESTEAVTTLWYLQRLHLLLSQTMYTELLQRDTLLRASHIDRMFTMIDLIEPPKNIYILDVASVTPETYCTR